MSKPNRKVKLSPSIDTVFIPVYVRTKLADVANVADAFDAIHREVVDVAEAQADYGDRSKPVTYTFAWNGVEYAVTATFTD